MKITNELTPKQYDICVKLYRRHLRLGEGRCLNAPKNVLNYLSKQVEKAKEELMNHHLTPENFKVFCDEYYQKNLDETAEELIREKCIHWLQHIQKCLKEEDFSNLSCIVENNGCKHNCKQFTKVTDEQKARFDNLENINTGEKLF